jgi:hypothetical protein
LGELHGSPPAQAAQLEMDEKMPNPLTKAIRSGDKANDEIGKSFARMGTSENPRGFVLAAYRNAHWPRR